MANYNFIAKTTDKEFIFILTYHNIKNYKITPEGIIFEFRGKSAYEITTDFKDNRIECEPLLTKTVGTQEVTTKQGDDMSIKALEKRVTELEAILEAVVSQQLSQQLNPTCSKKKATIKKTTVKKATVKKATVKNRVVMKNTHGTWGIFEGTKQVTCSFHTEALANQELKR